MIYCILNANNQIITLFGGPQNPPTPVGYTVMADTDARYTTYVASQTALANALAAYNAAINGGIVLTSTGTPALNGTYSTTDTAQKNISAIVTGIAAGLGLPGGGSTFQYLDANNQPHAFDSSHFTAFAAALRNFVYQCDIAVATIQNGGSATFPSNNVTIA